MPATPDLSPAVATLRRGGVIAYPTEAVWGLGCDPFDETAVIRLLALKQRPVGKGLILIASALAHLDGLLDWEAIPTDIRDRVLASWPGPHSWVVPASARVPRWITGDHAGVAVRVSAHPTVVALCTAFGGPLVSTSANLAGAEPPRRLDAFDPGLRAAVDWIVEGDTGELSSPTIIRDARNGTTLRL